MSKVWWFKHDYKAKTDNKLLELELEFGQHEGYSIWFRLLETLGECEAKLDKRKFAIYASIIRIDKAQFERFVAFCVSLGLLTDAGDYVYSERFTEDYLGVVAKSEKAKHSADSRWDKERERKADADADALRTHEKPKPMRPLVAKNAITDIPETEEIKKLRESVNELVNLGKDATVKKPNNVCCTLSNAQFQKLIDKHGINDKTLRKYYLWKFGTDKSVKDDYLSILNNIEKDWLRNDAPETKERTINF